VTCGTSSWPQIARLIILLFRQRSTDGIWNLSEVDDRVPRRPQGPDRWSASRIFLVVARARMRFRAHRTSCAIPPTLPKAEDLSDCGAHEARQTDGPVAKRPHLPRRTELGRRTHRKPPDEPHTHTATAAQTASGIHLPDAWPTGHPPSPTRRRPPRTPAMHPPPPPPPISPPAVPPTTPPADCRPGPHPHRDLRRRHHGHRR